MQRLFKNVVRISENIREYPNNIKKCISSIFRYISGYYWILFDIIGYYLILLGPGTPQNTRVGALGPQNTRVGALGPQNMAYVCIYVHISHTEIPAHSAPDPRPLRPGDPI